MTNETTGRYAPTDIAALICREVAELPERNSPPDWPEAMLVTADELHQIVTHALRQEDRPQADAEWLKEHERLAGLLGLAATNLDVAGSKSAFADIMAHAAQRPASDCTRSHPHENMDAMCELRTKIARLENQLAQRPAAQPSPGAWDIAQHIAGLQAAQPAPQELRGAFETWFRDYLGPLTTNVEKSAMFAAWQAALASRPVPPPVSDEQVKTIIQNLPVIDHGPDGLAAIYQVFYAGCAARDAQWKGGV